MKTIYRRRNWRHMVLSPRCALVAMTLLCLINNPVQADEIKIATVAPLTEERAWAGEQSRRGAELAVADLNAKGGVLGKQVSLTVGDDAADPYQAVGVARKLVNDGVVFVAGHRGSDASIAASPIYHAAGVIQISPSATNPLLTEQGFNNVFRVCGRDDQQGQMAGEYLASQFGERKIGIVHDGSIYGKGLATETKKTLNEKGINEVVFQRYHPQTREYSDLIESLQANAVEILYLGGYSWEAGLIMRQAHEQALDVRLVSGDALHNTDFWEISDQAGQGALFTFSADPREHPTAADVVRRFRDNGYEPEGYTLHTYAAIQVWAQAVERATTLDSDKVIAMLHDGAFDTVLGAISFTKKGDLADHQFVWYEWKDGGFYPHTN